MCDVRRSIVDVMLYIYLTLNHQIIAPQYITVAPHPATIAALYGTASSQYEAALSDLGTYKCGLILLASIQLSIKLILSIIGQLEPKCMCSSIIYVKVDSI